eukprot:14663-Hanusia_phi.AAC.2
MASAATHDFLLVPSLTHSPSWRPVRTSCSPMFHFDVLLSGFATASIFHSTAAVEAHFATPVTCPGCMREVCLRSSLQIDLPSTWQLAFIVLILHGTLYATVVSLGQAMGMEKVRRRRDCCHAEG